MRGFLLPAGEPGRLSLPASTQIVTLLNWAASPHLKRLNMAFVLIEEKLSALSERLVASPHTASIEIPLPDAAERLKYIEVAVSGASAGAGLGLHGVANWRPIRRAFR